MIAAVDDVPLAKLGRAIRERRLDLQLSEREAAKIAGVARNTWSAAESGSHAVRQYNHVGIERALKWAPGSVAEVLRGGDPAPVDAVSGAQSAAVRFDLEEELDRIEQLPVSAKTKLDLTRRIVRLYVEVQREGAWPGESTSDGRGPKSRSA